MSQSSGFKHQTVKDVTSEYTDSAFPAAIITTASVYFCFAQPADKECCLSCQHFSSHSLQLLGHRDVTAEHYFVR
jgi:predicted NAD-dependent protein-ADP-ribosyltransferase YbiA (DUF1768 family)